MGKDVTLVEMLETIASDLVNHLQHYLQERLGQKKVTILTSSRVLELGAGYAMVEDAAGVRRLNGFDTIVMAMGSSPNDGIYRRLEGRVAQLYLVGDAAEPREIADAVYEAQDAAINI